MTMYIESRQVRADNSKFYWFIIGVFVGFLYIVRRKLSIFEFIVNDVQYSIVKSICVFVVLF